MTPVEIGVAVALKGALVVFLVKKGWWPDWEARAYRREEHKRVIERYEEMVSQTGRRPCEDPNIPERLKHRPQVSDRQASR